MTDQKPAVLKYFSHKNCSVCTVLLPKVKALVNKKFPHLEIEQVDIEIDPQTAAQHQVFTAPTLLLIFEGKEYYRFARNFSMQQLEEAIARPYHLLFN